jgi:integrase
MALKLSQPGGAGTNYYLRGTVRKISYYKTTGTSDRKTAEEIRTLKEAELLVESVHGKKQQPPVHTWLEASVSYLESERRRVAMRRAIGDLSLHLNNMPLDQINQKTALDMFKKVIGVRVRQFDKDGAPIVDARGEQKKVFVHNPDSSASHKRNRVFIPISAVLRHAHEFGWCAAPSLVWPRLPKGKTDYFTPREAILLIENSPIHLARILTFMFGIGCRTCEALRLDWKTVDLEAKTALLMDTKNGGDRLAALPPAVVALLRGMPNKASSGRVFLRPDGQPYKIKQDKKEDEGQNHIGSPFRKAMIRAGMFHLAVDENGKIVLDEDGEPVKIVDKTPHDTRHSWASWFYAISKDLLLLKREGGWEALSQVERYAHLMPTEYVGDVALVWGVSHPQLGTLPGVNLRTADAS